jgi:hypothetical protein
MTTAIKTRGTKVSGRKAARPIPVSSATSKNGKQKPELIGLAGLLDADLPRSFETPAEVDAYIRALRDEWDD